jgi:colanic acid/amylovoran biosynthesis glycosyltransferase
VKIAMIVDRFPAVSETFILRQIVGLLALGHEVDVFADRQPAGDPVHQAVSHAGLDRRVRYAHDSRHAIPWWMRDVALAAQLAVRRPAALRLLRRARSAPYGGRRALLPRLGVLLPRPRYDVVHCHFGNVGLAYRFVTECWDAPLLVTFHGFDFSRDPRVFGPRLYEPLFAMVDGVTVNSAYARDRLGELGCARDALRILHIGVDPRDYAFRDRRLAPSHGGVRVLTVARLVEKKGVEYALRAVAQVAPTVPGLRYDIIGDGPLRAELEALARSLGVADRVTFHGAQEQDRVRSAMADADLFLLPSVTAASGDQEGTPTVLVEASSCGLPVVSSWHSGIPEVVLDGRTGCLVPERDVPALARQLCFLIAHPEVRARMGRLGRQHIEEHFDIRQLNRDLEALYRELITARRVPAAS